MILKKFFRRSSANDWYEYENPDGSKGGTVSVHATIEAGTYVPVGAIVGANSHITQKDKILDGDYVSGNRTVVRADKKPPLRTLT